MCSWTIHVAPQSLKSRPSLPPVSTRSFDQLLFNPGLSRAAELRHETICLPQQKRGVSTKCGHSRTQKRWQRLKIAGVSSRKVHTPPAQLVNAGPRCLNALLNRLLSSAKYGSERGAVLHPVSGRQRKCHGQNYYMINSRKYLHVVYMLCDRKKFQVNMFMYFIKDFFM